MNPSTYLARISEVRFFEGGKEHFYVDCLEIVVPACKGPLVELRIYRNYFIDGVYSEYGGVIYSASVPDEALERIHRLTAL